MRIAIYSRKSRYTGKGESVENQVQLCRDYIARNLDCPADTAIDVFEDEGFSGKNTDRPRFQQMMEKARQKTYDYIVCYRLDRISRNVSDFSSLINELQHYKTSFVCIREQFDTSTPMGRAMMYIASVFAQLERETIAERIRDNMRMLARSGRWLGGNTPLGFVSTMVRRESVDGKVKTSYELSPIADEIEVVKYIFESYVRLRSMVEVEQRLTEQEMLTRKGNDFTPITIREILSNPVYCVADEAAHDYFQRFGADICNDRDQFDGKWGIAAYNRTSHEQAGQRKNAPSGWIIAIGRHGGIIKSSVWIQVQQMLQANQRGAVHTRVHNPAALLSGLLLCGRCGAYMRPRVNSNKGANADGTRTFSYLCEQKKRSRGQKCQCVNLNGNAVDQAVAGAALQQYREGPDTAAKLLALRDAVVAQSKQGQGASRSIRTRILEKEREIAALIGILAKSDQNAPLYRYTEKEVEKLHTQRKLLLEQLGQGDKENDRAEHGDCVASLERELKDIAGVFKQSSVYQQREWLRAIIDRITWDGSCVHIFFSGEDTGSVDKA